MWLSLQPAEEKGFKASFNTTGLGFTLGADAAESDAMEEEVQVVDEAANSPGQSSSALLPFRIQWSLHCLQ